MRWLGQSDQDSTWTPTIGGLPAMSNWEEIAEVDPELTGWVMHLIWSGNALDPPA